MMDNSKILCVMVIGLFSLAGWLCGAPIATFDMDAVSPDGLTFTDGTANGHDATYNRAVTLYGDDPFGLMYSSSVRQTVGSGAGTWAYLANPGTVDVTADGSAYTFTMECWYKPTSFDPVGVNNGRSILMQMTGSEGGTTSIYFGVYDTGIPFARSNIKSGGWYLQEGTTAIPLNQWTHLALVDDAGWFRLYVNGAVVSSISHGRSMPTALTAATFGGYGTETNLGYIDDVGFYDTNLSLAELGYHSSYSPVPPEPEETILARFDFDSYGDDGGDPNYTHRIFTDITGNGHDATYNRALYLRVDDPFNYEDSLSVYQSVGGGAGCWTSLDSPGTMDLTDGGLSSYSMTMECWAYPRVFDPQDADARSKIMSISSDDGGTTSIYLGLDPEGTPYFKTNIKSGGWHTVECDPNDAVREGYWSHLALVCDSGQWTLYVNGVEMVTDTYARSLPGYLTAAYFGGYGQETLEGFIDDVGFYNYAVDPQELGYRLSYTPLYCGDSMVTKAASDISGPEDVVDCYVDEYDLAAMAGQWLGCTMPGDPQCQVAGEVYTITQGSVTVDGDLGEWPATLVWHDLDKDYYYPTGSPNDITEASFALQWNATEDKVYAAVKVTDTDHYFEDFPWNWDTSDRLEIYMQGDPNGGDEWGTGDRLYDKAQQYSVGPGYTTGISWAFWPTGQLIASGADIEYEVSVSGDVITYELGIQAFIWYGGLSGDATTQAALEAGDSVGFDIIADTKFTPTYTGDRAFGMASENLMRGKYRDADMFQRYDLLAGDCGLLGYLPADVDKNCEVDLADFAQLASDWMYCSDPQDLSCDQSWR